MMVARPSLIVYSFALKERPSYPEGCAEAHEHLKQLWTACTCLGMTEPVEGLNLSVEFPPKINRKSPLFHLLAAKVDLSRRASGMDYQAFLFEYQDIFGFIATLESNEENGHLNLWQDLLKEWDTCMKANELPTGLGESYLFTGICDAEAFSSSDPWVSANHLSSVIASQLGKDVINALPASKDAAWRAATFHLTQDYYCIWEGEPLNARRVMALLTIKEKRGAMFSWTVWPGPHQLAPFARYLMHSFKLRFAHQVFEHEIATLRNQSLPMDRMLEDLLSLYTQVGHEEFLSSDEIAKAQSELSQEQARSYGLLYSITRLKELSLTAHIAERNMRQLIPETYPETQRTSYSIFGQDLARAEWLREQIEVDLGYLEAVRERAAEGFKMTTVLLEREGQKTARRLNSLILLQGTLLGSITVGLLMLPAFDVHDKMSSPLIWSVIGLLMALALALPPLFARWHESYQRIDRIVGGALCAAVIWFGITAWAEFELPSIHVSYWNWSIYKVCSLLIGFLLGYLGVSKLETYKSKRRLGKSTDLVQGPESEVLK